MAILLFEQTLKNVGTAAAAIVQAMTTAGGAAPLHGKSPSWPMPPEEPALVNDIFDGDRYAELGTTLWGA